jgi:CRISPR-associated endonuclease/helicase Cas3
MKRYIAHVDKESGREQSLEEHLKGTAQLARVFSELFGAGEFAEKIARYHDIGKYSDKFQRRIKGEKIQVDHSSAGAQYFYEQNKTALGLAAAYCIAGHHGGIPDGGSKSQPQAGELYDRLQRKLEDFSAFLSDFEDDNGKLPTPKIMLNSGFQLAFFIRMVYSCLVDADWLDTECFVSGEKPRGKFLNIESLWRLYDAKLSAYEKPTREIDLMRTEILKNCLDMALGDSRVYTLTAPTGSGKTISSMAFALKHAAVKSKCRVIYIVPYNTIIEQNAAVFEDMLGKQHVIQHHSGIVYSNNESDPDYEKLLATENWDAPVIVTSSVRFFESLFANRPSECRKLHNIANSVLVFDEAQMIPVPYLLPCVEAIKELVVNYRCTAVLATATQSSLDDYFKPLELKEIVARPKEMYEFFKRVRYDSTLGKLSDEELAEKLSRHNQVLCIVNTRKRAQALAGMIDGALHLSTTMYPLHRSRVLSMIREKLENEERCIVISTSLIEAGVDVDFPVVYREKAGLDSIIQSAGRCNRENRRTVQLRKTSAHMSTQRDMPAILRHLRQLNCTLMICTT